MSFEAGFYGVKIIYARESPQKAAFRLFFLWGRGNFSEKLSEWGVFLKNRSVFGIMPYGFAGLNGTNPAVQ